MLPETMELRPMIPADVDQALRIIRDHDEDDYETATESYERYGVEDQYTLMEQGKVIGVTGCRYIEDTDRSYWLSWTYVDREYRGQGVGRAMLEELLGLLTERGVRKLFVNTSDLADPQRGSVYQDAIKMYEALGFRLELKYDDYYAPGESRLTYGRRVGPLYGLRPQVQPNSAGMELTGIEEIPETDDAYFVQWQYTQDGSMFTLEDLRRLARNAKDWKARCLFMGLPSDMPQVEEALQAGGFFSCGRLIDFYEDGLDEAHYRFNL